MSILIINGKTNKSAARQLAKYNYEVFLKKEILFAESFVSLQQLSKQHAYGSIGA